MSPEFTLIMLNIVVIALSYLVIYPRVAGSDARKLAINDMLTTVVVMLVAASLFWGSEYAFNLILVEANWFWFAIISYFMMEMPVMLWYYKKHNVWDSWDKW